MKDVAMAVGVVLLGVVGIVLTAVLWVAGMVAGFGLWGAILGAIWYGAYLAFKTLSGMFGG